MLNIWNTVAAASLASASLVLLFDSGAGPPDFNNGERHVLLTNKAHEPIVEIFVSDDGVRDWQQDLLGSSFLRPGRSVLIGEIDDRNGNCRVDVKAVLDDGSELVDRGVDACRDKGRAVAIP